MTEQRRTRWEYDLPYDLRQTAQQVDAAQGTGRPRPGFADDLEARLMRLAQEIGQAPGPRRPAWWTRLAMPALALGLLLPTLVVATALISLLTILVGSNVFTTPPSLPTPPPTSLSDRAILDSQFKPVVMAHLGIKLHLQARACGYTVTLDSAYADTEHAIFGYTVMGPRGRVYPSALWGFSSPMMTLTDNQGHSFVDEGYGRAGPIVGAAQGSMAIFRAPVGVVLPRAARLRLTFLSLDRDELRSPASASPRSCERATHSSVSGNGPKNLYLVTAQGPFAFAVTVPVAPLRVSVVNKTVQLNGARLLIQRLEMTPLFTRVYYRLSRMAASKTVAVTYLGQVGLGVPATMAAARPWLIFKDQTTFLRWQIWAAAQDCNVPRSARASVCTGPVWAKAWRQAAAQRRTLYIGLTDMPYADHSLYSVDYLAPLYTYRGPAELRIGATSPPATRASDKTRVLLRFLLTPQTMAHASSDVLP